jgi:hypothetical protein
MAVLLRATFRRRFPTLQNHAAMGHNSVRFIGAAMVIMTTAYRGAGTNRKALERAAGDIFVKPVDFLMLRNDLRIERTA